MKNVCIVLLTTLLISTSCKHNDLQPEAHTTEQNGYATGKVVDTQGNPMPGIDVYVDHTIFYSSGMSGTTNQKGEYKIKVQPGSWRTYATMERTYNGRIYKIELHPDSYDSFGEEGAVRNFVWKLTGEKPTQSNTFYGGSVQLGFDPNSNDNDIHNVDVTFTPVGPLIDGSAGQTLTRKSIDDPLGLYYSYIMDVPIGRYKITATYRPTGKRLKVKNMASFEDSYQDSVIMDFFGKDSPRACTNCMAIEFSAP